MQNRMLRIALLSLVVVTLSALTLGAQDKPAPKEFDNLWVPGLAGGVFIPFNNTGLYAGGSFRFDLLYGLDSQRPDSFWADRGRWEIFADVGLYGDVSNRNPGHDLLFLWQLGFTISLETPASLQRNFLIPYMGLSMGGLTSTAHGTGLVAMPTLGINIISLPNCNFSLESSLLLNTIAFDEYLGLMVRANLNFTL